VTQHHAAELSEALKLWTGYDTSSWPKRDDAAIKSTFGTQKAEEVLAELRAIERDFYRYKAHAEAETLAEAGAGAKEEFRRLHPELPNLISDIFAWCYTYDYK
jgi:hypothetical protein